MGYRLLAATPLPSGYRLLPPPSVYLPAPANRCVSLPHLHNHRDHALLTISTCACVLFWVCTGCCGLEEGTGREHAAAGLQRSWCTYRAAARIPTPPARPTTPPCTLLQLIDSGVAVPTHTRTRSVLSGTYQCGISGWDWVRCCMDKPNLFPDDAPCCKRETLTCACLQPTITLYHMDSPCATPPSHSKRAIRIVSHQQYARCALHACCGCARVCAPPLALLYRASLLWVPFFTSAWLRSRHYRSYNLPPQYTKLRRRTLRGVGDANAHLRNVGAVSQYSWQTRDAAARYGHLFETAHHSDVRYPTPLPPRCYAFPGLFIHLVLVVISWYHGGTPARGDNASCA